MDLATIQIKVDTRQVKAANQDIKQLGNTGQATSKKVNAANDDMAKSAKSTTSAFKLLGGALAALGVGALVSNFTRTVTESERLKGSLTTMTGSIENAAFAFGELERFASQTPYTLDQSVEGFIKLKALGLDPSERALKSYGNTAAAMGKDLMQMVEAVADASTGEFERLKEFGIKASKEGERVSLTFQGMTTTIGNSSQEIQEYLLAIGETQFGSAMEDQMKRLPGLLSNLEDNVAALFRKLGDVGGIKLFSSAITGASAVIVGITNNLDVLAIGLSAALAGFVAFSAGSIAASIVAGFSRMRAAVLALNLAIRANPIAFVASAITAAAVVIIANWDKIKVAAERAGVQIQIAFEKVKIFLMESFARALNSIINLFSDFQDRAIATMGAVAAAARDPLSAFETFNEVFDETLAGLKSGRDSADVFSGSIEASKSRVIELEGSLETMNTEVVTTNEVVGQAVPSLSDFAIQIDEGATGASNMADELEAVTTKTQELLGQLSNETEALSMSSREIDIRNNLQRAGVEATSELGEQIVAATNNFHDEKEAISQAADQAKRLAEEQAEIARRNEEIKSGLSDFFVDMFENGRDAFDNLAKQFKAMILKMIADWAASKIVEMISGTFSGIGTSISGIFSGIFSSIGTSISGLASSAASVLSSLVGGGGAAAAQTAIAAGTSTMAANAALGASTVAAGGTAAATTAATTAAAAAAAQSSIAAGTSTMAANAAAAAASTGAATGGTAATTATTAAAGGGNAITSALKSFGPAAIFAYLAFKWDIFGLNRPNYPTFAELPPAVQAEQMLEAFNANMPMSLVGPDMEETEGMAGFEPAILIDLYRRIEGQLGEDGTDTLEKIQNHPLLQTSLYDMTHGSFRSGLDFVPHDGFVAELHAGERVQTAEQARSSDSMADQISGLRQSVEEVMIAVARNTGKLYRLNDRWDKNGLPPVRA